VGINILEKLATPVFRVEVVSTMEVGAAGFSASLVTTYETTWLHNTEDHSVNFHCCENLKSHLEGSISCKYVRLGWTRIIESILAYDTTYCFFL
jgi:hypothetical protein